MNNTATKFRRGEVTVLSLAHLAHDTFSSFLAPLLPLLIDKLGLSLSQSAFLDIVRRIPALFNPLLGIVAEKTGIKYFVILTPSITALSMGLLGLANSFGVLLILLFVAGISAALFHIPSPVIVKEASGNKIGTGMSFFMVGGEAARTLGPLLVISGVSLWSLEEIYRLIPLGLAASLILFWKLKDLDVNRSIGKTKLQGNSRALVRIYWRFFSVIAAFLCFKTAIKSALTLYLPVYLTDQGAALWYAGLSLSLLQFFGVLGTLLAGHISDRIGRQHTLVIASTAMVIAMALFVWSQNIVFLAFLGLFLFAPEPVLLASIQETGSNMPTFMNSMYMFINFGISSIMVFAVGFTGDWVGLKLTYICAAAFALGTVPLAFLLERFKR